MKEKKGMKEVGEGNHLFVTEQPRCMPDTKKKPKKAVENRRWAMK